MYTSGMSTLAWYHIMVSFLKDFLTASTIRIEFIKVNSFLQSTVVFFTYFVLLYLKIAFSFYPYCLMNDVDEFI